MVPHLTTALTGPLLELERRILDNGTAVERWLRTQWLEHTPPFYSSVDLRNAGFKLAPVDTNLFPGGFNNLNPAFLPLCVQAAMSAIEKICPEARNLLLIPENHTRNQFYPTARSWCWNRSSGSVPRAAGWAWRISIPAPSCSTTTFPAACRPCWKTSTNSS